MNHYFVRPCAHQRFSDNSSADNPSIHRYIIHLMHPLIYCSMRSSIGKFVNWYHTSTLLIHQYIRQSIYPINKDPPSIIQPIHDPIANLSLGHTCQPTSYMEPKINPLKLHTIALQLLKQPTTSIGYTAINAFDKKENIQTVGSMDSSIKWPMGWFIHPSKIINPVNSNV